ncbi:hypothetical protein AYL99_12122 [Fonsecaea erecta]|uniref:Uncharacterized protein n=1 Tax=Fonsecaea erecta TaxID=1367422 RepID=A0A178Z1N8_9EURO|nr:hypothetical protein AYL99_12122 [Fonsecaea erecta]OAP53702.1 hypothetical protein AYL99_12122 [Fonsecaea erecta]
MVHTLIDETEEILLRDLLGGAAATELDALDPAYLTDNLI